MQVQNIQNNQLNHSNGIAFNALNHFYTKGLTPDNAKLYKTEIMKRFNKLEGFSEFSKKNDIDMYLNVDYVADMQAHISKLVIKYNKIIKGENFIEKYIKNNFAKRKILTYKGSSPHHPYSSIIDMCLNIKKSFNKDINKLN